MFYNNNNTAADKTNHGRNRLLQLIILGHIGVGKTALIKTYCDGYYKDVYNITIGVDCSLKTLKTADGEQIKLRIFEGKNPDSRMFINIQSYLLSNNTNAIIIVCDLSLNKGYSYYQREISLCMNEFNSDDTNVLKVIVGSKLDLNTNKKSVEALTRLADEYDCLYQSVSAKNNEGLEELFNTVINNLHVINEQEATEKPAPSRFCVLS